MRARCIAREALKLLFYYPVAEIAIRMPLPAAYSLAAAAGQAYGCASRRRSRIIRREIGKLFARDASDVPAEVARRACALFAKNQIELMRAPRLPPDRLLRLVTVVGKEHLDAALARGSGAVLLLIHFGANQLIIPVVRHLGYDLLQLGAPPQGWHDLLGREPTELQKRIFAKNLQVERALGVEFLYIDRSLRPAYKALKGNRVLAVAVDGRAGARFVPVPFGARTAMLSPGPVGLAFRTGAALLPTFIVREPGNTHRLIFHAAMPVAGANGDPLPPADVLADFARLAMTYIEHYPCHYGWLLQAAWHRAPLDKVPLFQDLGRA